MVIADDHDIVRSAVAHMLAELTGTGPYGYEVVATAAHGLEALAQVKDKKPDLLFLDVSMPFANGVEIVHDVKRWSPLTRIVVFTGVTASGALGSLLEQGVDGLFSKASPLDAMREKLQVIVAGGRVIDETLAERLQEGDTVKLTNREQQVLAKIVAGKSNREIAEDLFLSPKTVDKHRTSLMQKLDVHSLAQLMSRALRDGLVVAE